MIFNKPITINLPPISDETAAAIQHFMYSVLSAIDERYYAQISRHCFGTKDNSKHDTMVESENF